MSYFTKHLCRKASDALRDVMLGVMVGSVFWPIALGHGLLANLPPASIAATVVLPPLLYSLLGSVPVVAIQTSAVAALCIGEVVHKGESVGLSPPEVASLTAAIIAVVHFILAVLDLSWISELFSRPLLKGRTAATVTMILGYQAKTLLGINSISKELAPLPHIIFTAISFREASVACAVLSLSMICLWLLLHRLGAWSSMKAEARLLSQLSSHEASLNSGDGPLPQTVGCVVPSSLVDHPQKMKTAPCRRCLSRVASVCRQTGLEVARALSAIRNVAVLIGGSVVYRYLDQRRNEVRLVPRIESMTLAWSVPRPTIEQLTALAPTAGLIAFLTYGGHLIVANRLRKTSDKWNPRRELFALSASSAASAIGGGMPPAANLAVSQALRHSTWRLALVGNSVGHFMAFWLVANYSAFQQVPACAVAVIITVEFAPLIVDIPRDMIYLLRQARVNGTSVRSIVTSDFGIYLAAFLSPLALGVVVGSVVSLILELVFAVSKFAGSDYTVLGRVPGTNTYDEIGVEGSRASELPYIRMIRFNGSSWFGNIISTTRSARRDRLASGREVHCVIIDMRMVAFVDETALAYFASEWNVNSWKIIATNICFRVRRELENSGILLRLNQPEDTLVDLHAAVTYAEQHIQTVLAERVAIGVRHRGAEGAVVD
eukprot:TRINITY_DN27226_c0_g1_i1.p1 TRINITY_DN27226_c0_g1~~TRINITY_DN27226_c0_g1_i1.p1  ORF type:complete len:661 (+),score=41.19 TRINITY_DN27226_c0_g1_i1:56-2038(+)